MTVDELSVALAIEAGRMSRGQALLDAAGSGDVSACERLLAAGCSPERTLEGFTPLHLAAMYGHDEVCSLLIRDGADLNEATPTTGSTALALAAAHSNPACCAKLIQAGADARPSGDALQPLAVAAREGRVANLNLLIDAGALVNAAQWDGWTALHNAASSGRLEALRRLIDLGADVDALSSVGTPLLVAAQSMSASCCAELLSRGARAGATDDEGNTALHQAARWADAETIAALVDGSADIHARAGDGATPLHRAAASGKLNAARALLDRGADVELLDARGSSPLDLAVAFRASQTEGSRRFESANGVAAALRSACEERVLARETASRAGTRERPYRAAL